MEGMPRNASAQRGTELRHILRILLSDVRDADTAGRPHVLFNTMPSLVPNHASVAADAMLVQDQGDRAQQH